MIGIFNKITGAVLGEIRDVIHGDANLGKMIEKRYSSGGNSQQDVTVDEAMTIPAVEASVELITSSIAKLPIKLYREDGAHEVFEIRDDNRIFLLNREPNNVLNGHNLKKQIVQDYLFHGEVYIKMDKTPTGKDIALHILNPEYMTKTRYMRSGYLTDVEYIYEHPEFKNKIKFDKHDLIVILKNSRDGVDGKGLLEQGQSVFRLALNEMEYSKSLLENGAVPLGMLTTDKIVTEPAMKRIRESFDNAFQGAKNAGKTMILEEGLTYKPVSLNPGELDLTNSKKTTLSNISRLFGIPESMISTQANKYASTEQNNIHFLQYCIAPIISSMESGLNRSFMRESEKMRNYRWVVDTAGILQTTEKEKIEAIGIGLEKGLFTVNEARRKMNQTDITTNDYYTSTQGKIFINKDTGVMTLPNIGKVIDPNKIDKASLLKSDILKLEKLLEKLDDPEIDLDGIDLSKGQMSDIDEKIDE